MVKYHVGSNIPGYLPECDIYCTDDIQSAVQAFRGGLRDQQDYYHEQCEESLPEDCECEWCDTASNVEADLSAITDQDVAYSVKAAGRYDTLYWPQEGPDISHWVQAVAGCECEEGN